jgi:condensin complex subunit 1
LILFIFQVFSQDKSIYEAVESAFITLYTRNSPTETAKRLLDLAIDCSIGDLAALESLISSLVSKAEISSSTVRPSFPIKFALATTLNVIIC